jgi:pyruvate/2-oxoacid:ferredoxin oxidoreductase alpha subunit
MTSFGIGLLIEKPVELDEHHEEADILFIGFISSKGAIQEGAESHLTQQAFQLVNLMFYAFFFPFVDVYFQPLHSVYLDQFRALKVAYTM